MQGKLIGKLLIVGAIIADILIGLVMFVPVLEGGRSWGAAILGYTLFSVIIVLPVVGAGIYFHQHGAKEAVDQESGKKMRQLLNMVKTRGQIGIADLAIELDTDRDQIQKTIYDLVGRGLFIGYVNWDDGVLYSEQAATLRELDKCRHCGGQLALAGKGVVHCPYCGTEYFL